MAENRFATSLEALEKSAHVPDEEQVAEIAEDPAESPVSPDALNRMRAVSIEHNFRW